MAAPTGLYAHVEANNRRSLLLFGMFAVAFQLLAAATLFLLLVLFDPAHAPVYHNAEYLRRYVPLVFLFSMVVFAAQLWWFVGAVRGGTAFRYVDSVEEPRLCGILEPLAIAVGIRVPYAAVIETPALNAFACGWREQHMVVVATRGLIDSLDDDELAAVLANAVSHIRNRDTKLLAAATTFMRNMMVFQRKRGLTLWHPIQIVPLIIFPMFVPIILILGFFSQVAYRIAYGSRALIGISRELIADAEAVRLTHNPAALISALQRINAKFSAGAFGDAFDAMLFVGATHGPLATHPTLDERTGALARTTGSLALDTAPHRDTRPIELRSAAGFGRRPDPSVERIALLAEAPEQRGFWAAFRSVRDPERNLFNLNRRGMLILAVSIVGIVGAYHRTFAEPHPIAKLFDPAGVGQFAGLGAMAARCEFALIVKATAREQCEKDAVVASSMFDQVPMFKRSDGKPREYLTQTEKDEREVAGQIARGCFDGRWDGFDKGSWSPPNRLETYLRFGPEGALRLQGVPPGPRLNAQLINYAETRLLLMENSLHFFGESGLASFNQAVDSADHRAAIATLRDRLKDSAFLADVAPLDRANITLLAQRGPSLRPCWAGGAQG